MAAALTGWTISVVQESKKDEVVPVVEVVDYSAMNLADLKELLKEKGLPVSGKKDELIERLQSAVTAPVTETEVVAEAENAVVREEVKKEEETAE